MVSVYNYLRVKVSHYLTKSIIDIIAFTLMVLIKVSKFIIYTCILLITKYVEFTFLESFGSFSPH